jgi:hypothetical protein
MGWKNLNQTAAAELLGCSQPVISKLCKELHVPETALQLAIEEATAADQDSPIGTITPRDWVEWQREKSTNDDHGAKGDAA